MKSISVKTIFRLLLCSFALTLISCEKEYLDKPEVSTPISKYTAPAEGAKYSLEITTRNVSSWSFESNVEWIGCVKWAGSWGGVLLSYKTLSITVAPSELTESRTGTVTLSAEGVKDFIITITQEAYINNEVTVIWDNNSRFFAKLLDEVASVNFVEDLSEIKLVEFDKKGYVKQMSTKYDEGGALLVTKYEYDLQNRLQRIGFFNAAGTGIGMSIVINYTEDHNNYIDIGHTFLGGLEFVKAFQPRFLKGVKSVVTTTLADGSYEIKYLFSGLNMRVENSEGTLLGIATYGVDGFVETQTNYLATKKDGVDYYVDFHETYKIDTRSGKYETITYVENWRPANSEDGESTTTEPFVVTYLNDKYNNKQKEGASVVFTYDQYGEFLLITAANSSDSYSYMRDSKGNWTQRVDNAVFFGEQYEFTDNRSVKYYAK